MKSNIFIPKTIKVGYQHREDTYTKKLAYVIYYDQKGVLRKETSWKGWIHDKVTPSSRRNPETGQWERIELPAIEPQDFENVPTEGFVLNKKVGGDRYSWNPRQTYTRVYDPRGFEFEITIPNLLYILENTNSIKGKGLEGKFVYGWDGKELVLIPEEAPELEAIKEFTEMQAVSFSKKDLIPGHVYLTKTNVEVMYMGHFTEYSSNGTPLKSKKHFFFEKRALGTDTEWRLETRSGYQHIAKKLSDFPDPDFAQLFEGMERSSLYSARVEDKLVDISLKEFKELLENCSYGRVYFETTDSSGFHFTLSTYPDGTKTTYKLSDVWRREFIKNANYQQYSYVHDRAGYAWWDKEKNYREQLIKQADCKKSDYYTAEEIFEKFNPKQLVTILANGKQEQR